jgi:diphosphomevalonate decarboxylase
MKLDSLGRAEACANIALAKYWGKSEAGDNLTDVPSLSLTLDALRTRTEVVFSDQFTSDGAWIDGQQLSERPLKRVSDLLDRIRALTNETRRARVISQNGFPTAAGLASSASGFAALAVAASEALKLPLTLGRLSSQARKSSASAGRSLFEGFAVLLADQDEALPAFGMDHWDVAMVVAVVASGPKKVASTGGMVHTKATSPYYDSWKNTAPIVFEQIHSGVRQRDFFQVAEAMEHSTRLMHATMLTSLPPILYLQGPTIEIMHEIATRRAAGEPVAYTMDAGPNVKVLTPGDHAEETARFLGKIHGVSRTIICRPGPGATTLDHEGALASARRDDGRPGYALSSSGQEEDAS